VRRFINIVREKVLEALNAVKRNNGRGLVVMAAGVLENQE
jgi:hypothetical protein